MADSNPPYKILLPRTSLMIKDSTWQPRSTTDPNTGETSWRHAKILDGIWITTLENPQRPDRRPSDPDDQSMQEITFVEGSRTGETPKPNVQRVVKSHARRWAYRDQRKKREERDRVDATSSSMPTAYSSTMSIAATCQSKDHMDLLIEGRIKPALGPYGPLCFSVRLNQHVFVEFFHHVVAPIVFPIHKRLTYNPALREWFPIAMADKLSFTVACWVSAMFKTLISRSEDFSEAEHLMQNIISQLLPRLDGTVPSEGTINAVATIVGMEFILGHRQNFLLHRQGLVELTRLKGGLSGLGAGVQLKACRVDCDGASEWLIPPVLSLPIPGRALFPIGLDQPHMRTKERLFKRLIGITSFTSTLHDALCDLWCLTAAFAETFQDASGNTKVHPINLDFDIMHIQHALLKLLDADLSSFHRACQLGALIYVQTLIKNIPPPFVCTTLLVQELKKSLQMIGEDLRSDNTFPLMVWLYTMGALATYTTSEHIPFMQGLASLLPSTNGQMSTYDMIESAVTQILWIEELHGFHLKQYWVEFENASNLDLYISETNM